MIKIAVFSQFIPDGHLATIDENLGSRGVTDSKRFFLGFSAPLKHVSLFGRVKIGVRARPNFRAAKKLKTF